MSHAGSRIMIDHETEYALVRKYGAAGVTHEPLVEVCNDCRRELGTGHDVGCSLIEFEPGETYGGVQVDDDGSLISPFEDDEENE